MLKQLTIIWKVTGLGQGAGASGWDHGGKEVRTETTRNCPCQQQRANSNGTSSHGTIFYEFIHFPWEKGGGGGGARNLINTYWFERSFQPKNPSKTHQKNPPQKSNHTPTTTCISSWWCKQDSLRTYWFLLKGITRDPGVKDHKICIYLWGFPPKQKW